MRLTYLISIFIGLAQAIPFKGVNIGGWLVLESWITPTLFSQNNVPSGSGEWQFCEQLGKAACLDALTPHWDSWVNESEIAILSSAGITHLRVPIGYWILGGRFIEDGEPFVAGEYPYLLRLLGWAKKYNLQVVLQLHAAPGSQNGHDNSGKSGGVIDWDKGNNTARTVDMLTELAKNMTVVNAQPATLNVVSGIGLLNEPWTIPIGGPIEMDYLQSFYLNATNSIRSTGFQGDLWLSDGWNKSWTGWSGFLTPPNYSNIYFDTHNYYCFDSYHEQLPMWGLIKEVCAQDGPSFANYPNDWLIVGEFTAALSQGPSYPFDEDGKAYLRSFLRAQWEAAGIYPSQSGVKGGFFWNFKIETGYEAWNYLLGIREGWAPNLTLSPPVSAFSCKDIV
jgi:glucan 1,3-beta-glucosidase